MGNLRKKKTGGFRTKLIILLICFCVPLSVWFLIQKYEGEQPSVSLNLSAPAIGAKARINIVASDKKSGLRKIRFSLMGHGVEKTLLEKEFPSSGFFSGSDVHHFDLDVVINPVKMKIPDGKAVLRVLVTDYSLRGWFDGNRTYLEKPISIDTKPPEIQILSKFHNIKNGGSCLVIYQVSEPCTSGVQVEDLFFPGYENISENKNIRAAFFALKYNQGRDTIMSIKAEDPAGNHMESGFPHHVRLKKYPGDVIRIPDSFLKWKMPEFADQIKTDSTDPVERFLYVNRTIRKENTRFFQSLAKHSESKIFWNGPFLRLPKSARRSGFADQRDYRYSGKKIDEQVHLGVDLASISHAPIPAANSGRVVFAGSIGIYGKTVVIDHGFGLFSTYSHLSEIHAKAGEIVEKGDIIGKTGKTGLAGGDHLHFGIMVNGLFVDPVEWWDGSWIENNVASKINELKS